MSNRPEYHVKRFPLTRRAVIDSGRLARRRHIISGLYDMDVTEARRILSAHKARTGESISFTAFILACLGRAIDANLHMHAYQNMWGRLILFEEVDCTTMIEIELQGQAFPLAHIIRAINKRDVYSIHDEIRAIKADPQGSMSLRSAWYMGPFLLLPAFVRDIIYGLIHRMPRLIKKTTGTIVVSSVGMFGMSGGWGLGPGSIFTMSVLLAGVTEKPAVVDGNIAIREMLQITVQVNHDIIDGAPAMRFGTRLKELVESAYGLEPFAEEQNQ